MHQTVQVALLIPTYSVLLPLLFYDAVKLSGAWLALHLTAPGSFYLIKFKS